DGRPAGRSAPGRSRPSGAPAARRAARDEEYDDQSTRSFARKGFSRVDSLDAVDEPTQQYKPITIGYDVNSERRRAGRREYGGDEKPARRGAIRRRPEYDEEEYYEEIEEYEDYEEEEDYEPEVYEEPVSIAKGILKIFRGILVAALVVLIIVIALREVESSGAISLDFVRNAFGGTHFAQTVFPAPESTPLPEISTTPLPEATESVLIPEVAQAEVEPALAEPASEIEAPLPTAETRQIAQASPDASPDASPSPDAQPSPYMQPSQDAQPEQTPAQSPQVSTNAANVYELDESELDFTATGDDEYVNAVEPAVAPIGTIAPFSDADEAFAQAQMDN
ncbi:MAG: hypothetical protein Q4D04_11870, partial [Clostridia bacterium]|nr:hypothetical protein [Clostridia bacterium]